jgi:hypothetical protein
LISNIDSQMARSRVSAGLHNVAGESNRGRDDAGVGDNGEGRSE